MLNAGDLRERVVHMRIPISRIQGVETRGAAVEVGTYWASVRFVSGRERLQAQQVQSTANVEVRLRWEAGQAVRATDYFEWNGYRLEVRGEPIPAQDRSEVVVMCEAKRV